MRHRLLAVAIVCIGVASCTADDDAVQPAPTTTIASATTIKPSAPNTSAPSVASVAEGEGWRLRVTSPAPDSTIKSRATLCYEVTGTSRESIVALRVSLAGAETRPSQDLPIAVGRGTALVDFGSVGRGVYDLRVQLIVDGRAQNRLVLNIPVTIGAAAPGPDC